MIDRVTISDGVILHTLRADISADSLKTDLKTLAQYAHDLREANKPVIMVVDSTLARRVNSQIREQALSNLAVLNCDRIGVFGLNPYMTHIASWILWVSRNEKRIKLFGTKEEAFAYVKGFKPTK